jgi:hypothetical protein
MAAGWLPRPSRDPDLAEGAMERLDCIDEPRLELRPVALLVDAAWPIGRDARLRPAIKRLGPQPSGAAKDGFNLREAPHRVS